MTHQGAADNRKLITISMVLTATVVILLITNIFLARRVVEGQPDPIAVTSTGTVIPVTRLDQRYVTESQAISYTQQCVQRAFSHDFANFRMTFEDSTKCFTPEGVKSYAQTMQPLLEKIRKKRLIMSIAEGPFVVAQAGKLDGVYVWQIQGRVTLYLQGTTADYPPEAFDATINVVRVPLQENVRGISLSSISLSPVALNSP
jgi:hypothetical protein